LFDFCHNDNSFDNDIFLILSHFPKKINTVLKKERLFAPPNRSKAQKSAGKRCTGAERYPFLPFTA
jgi:hypothetical protein